MSTAPEEGSDPSDSPPAGGGGPSEARSRESEASLAPEDDTLELPDASPPPQAEAAPPPPLASEITLTEFSAAWPVIVARVRSDFGARRHAFVRVAEPESVEGGVAVLTLPAHQHFHLEQLKADDQLLQALEAITAEVLGSAVTLQFRSDGDTEPVPTEEPTRAPDREHLDDGPTREDPEDLIADMLGGTVVEE